MGCLGRVVGRVVLKLGVVGVVDRAGDGPARFWVCRFVRVGFAEMDDCVGDGGSSLDMSNGRFGDPTYLGCSEELGGGFSCGFVGAGFARGVGDVGAGSELAEAVGCGDSGLGGDHVCADFGYFCEGIEELVGLGGFEPVEKLARCDGEMFAELREAE